MQLPTAPNLNQMPNRSNNDDESGHLSRIYGLIGSTPFLSAVIATVSLLLVASLAFGAFSLLKVASQDLTTTVAATTESMSLMLKEDRQSSWNLPRGIYLSPADPKKNGVSCKENKDPALDELRTLGIAVGLECTTEFTTRLVIEGIAKVEFVLTRSAGWSMSIVGPDELPIDAKLFDRDGGLLLETASEFRFQSSQIGIRFPLVAASTTLGAHLHYASSVNDKPSDLWQPALLSGNVSIIARNLPDDEKYDVLHDALDSGDVIGIEGDKDGLIWGMATIDEQSVALSGMAEIEQPVIHAVLHTSHRQISVRRFGTPEGHTIRAGTWTIISRWPNGQESWVAFMSLTVILTFVLQLADSLKHKPRKSKEKGKKDRKRIRKSD
jgi:hypothetical protein